MQQTHVVGIGDAIESRARKVEECVVGEVVKDDARRWLANDVEERVEWTSEGGRGAHNASTARQSRGLGWSRRSGAAQLLTA